MPKFCAVPAVASSETDQVERDEDNTLIETAQNMNAEHIKDPDVDLACMLPAFAEG